MDSSQVVVKRLTIGVLFVDSYIKKQVLLDGKTGKLAFDNNGDRLFSEYEIININHEEEPVRVGQYFYSKVNSFPISLSVWATIESIINWDNNIESAIDYVIHQNPFVISSYKFLTNKLQNFDLKKIDK